MHRSLFLSSISLAAALGGCSDDTCGPGSAPTSGLFVGDDDQKLTFGNLRSGQNHDCPDASAPDVEPLTVGGTQTDGQGLITLCIPRPDLLAGGVPLGGTGVLLIDLSGQVNGCSYEIERTRPITGTVSGAGVTSRSRKTARRRPRRSP
jgi:hypothetical protein